MPSRWEDVFLGSSWLTAGCRAGFFGFFWYLSGRDACWWMDLSMLPAFKVLILGLDFYVTFGILKVVRWLIQYYIRKKKKKKKKKKKVREKSRECHGHKPQPFPDPKRKRKPTNPNKHKSNKRSKSTKISSIFPKRGNRNTKRIKKHKNKMTHGKTYNTSPRRINHKATKSKTNTGNLFYFVDLRLFRTSKAKYW